LQRFFRLAEFQFFVTGAAAIFNVVEIISSVLFFAIEMLGWYLRNFHRVHQLMNVETKISEYR